MVELIVSAVIIALLGAAMAQALIASGHLSADQRHRAVADELAQQDQERLRGLSSQELDDVDGQARGVSLDGTSYTITSTARFLSTSGSSSCGSSGTGAAAYYRTSSSATWGGNLRGAVVEDGVVTPHDGGVLLTQVHDQTDSALSGVTVAASGPDYETSTTNSDGCAVLAGLKAGSYTLTLTKAGYIDANGNASPLTRSAIVTSSGTAAPTGGNPIDMAQPGAINAVFTSEGGTLTGQQADALSWIGAGSTYGMSSPSSYGPVTPASTLPTSGGESLYPYAFTGPSYTDNYRVWAGKCPQMQPPTGIGEASVAPGSSQTLSIAEPALNVVVSYGGVRVAPAHVKLSFTSTSGTSCTDSWSAPVAASAATSANGSLASPGQPFVSSATSGSTESASTYAGTLAVCADYQSHELTVSNLTNTNFTGSTLVTVPILSTSTSGTC
jgi:hypothetical protein